MSAIIHAHFSHPHCVLPQPLEDRAEGHLLFCSDHTQEVRQPPNTSILVRIRDRRGPNEEQSIKLFRGTEDLTGVSHTSRFRDTYFSVFKRCVVHAKGEHHQGPTTVREPHPSFG